MLTDKIALTLTNLGMGSVLGTTHAVQSWAAKVSLNVRALPGSRLLQYGPFGKGSFPAHHHQNLGTLLHPRPALYVHKGMEVACVGGKKQSLPPAPYGRHFYLNVIHFQPNVINGICI